VSSDFPLFLIRSSPFLLPSAFESPAYSGRKTQVTQRLVLWAPFFLPLFFSPLPPPPKKKKPKRGINFRSLPPFPSILFPGAPKRTTEGSSHNPEPLLSLFPPASFSPPSFSSRSQAGSKAHPFFSQKLFSPLSFPPP